MFALLHRTEGKKIQAGLYVSPPGFNIAYQGLPYNYVKETLITLNGILKA